MRGVRDKADFRCDYGWIEDLLLFRIRIVIAHQKLQRKSKTIINTDKSHLWRAELWQCYWEESRYINSTTCIIVTYDIFCWNESFLCRRTYNGNTHGEIVNFSHIQIFLFRLKSRKTSAYFIAFARNLFSALRTFFKYSLSRIFYTIHNFQNDSIEKNMFLILLSQVQWMHWLFVSFFPHNLYIYTAYDFRMLSSMIHFL